MTEDLCNKAHVALQNKTPLMRRNIGKKQEEDQITSAPIHPKRRGSGIFQRRWMGGERPSGGRGRGNFLSWVEWADATLVVPIRGRISFCRASLTLVATSEVTIWNLQKDLDGRRAVQMIPTQQQTCAHMHFCRITSAVATLDCCHVGFSLSLIHAKPQANNLQGWRETSVKYLRNGIICNISREIKRQEMWPWDRICLV